MTASAPAAFLEASLAVAPLGRAGAPEDVAPLVGHLLSDESAYVSGAEIAVDGGQSAHGGAKALSDALHAAAGEGRDDAALTNGAATTSNSKQGGTSDNGEGGDAMTRDRGAGVFPYRLTLGLCARARGRGIRGARHGGTGLVGDDGRAAACGTLPKVAPNDPQGAIKTTTAKVKTYYNGWPFTLQKSQLL